MLSRYMTEHDIDSYIEMSLKQADRMSSAVKDFSVFDLNYLPDKPLIRDEVRRIIDVLVKYHKTGIPRHMLIAGGRGAGKTMTMKHLARTFSARLGLSFYAANCRINATSFKVLATILKVRPRGYSYSELCARFEEAIGERSVIVLDEVDLLSEKDFRKDVLYFLSRSPRRYNLILLSNNPKFLSTLDESTRSSLQPDLLVFRNYTAIEIEEILRQRARAGLKSYDEGMLAQIAALTARNTNSDIRIAIKSLLYLVTREDETVEKCFERARQDIVADMIRNLSDKTLLVLLAVVEDPTGFVKQIYSRYCMISQQAGHEPFSYFYYYSQLSFLQSIGLCVLVSAKVDRAYTNRCQPLVSREQVEEALRSRIQP